MKFIKNYKQFNSKINESHINEEFYLGSDDVVGVNFKLKEPLKLTNGKEYNVEDTWVIDKAIDDDHYCTNTKTGEEEVFHTDIILGDTVMSDEDAAKFN